MKKLFLLLAVCLMAGTTHVFGQAEKVYDENNYFYASDITEAKAGEQVVVPLYFKNTEKICALQFDAHIGKMLSLDKELDEFAEEGQDPYLYKVEIAGRTKEGRHNTTTTSRKDLCEENDNEVFRVLSVSLKNDTYTGNDGAIYNLTLNVSKDAKIGDVCTVTFREMVLSNPDGLTSYYTKDFSIKVYVTEATGINGITASENADVYNANGQKQNKVRKGFNILRKNDGTTVKVVK